LMTSSTSLDALQSVDTIFFEDDELILGVTDEDFLTHFGSLDGSKTFVPHEWAVNVLVGRKDVSKFRRVYWPMFMKCSSSCCPLDLMKYVEQRRADYRKLIEKHRLKSSDLLTLDPQTCHPLSTVAHNPWNQKKQNEELREQIWKDVKRTFQERPLFRLTHTQKALQEVLFTWSKENPDVSYKQGMNELVAVIYLACYRDQYMSSESDIDKLDNISPKNLCALLCAREFIEADTFILFSRLMDIGMKRMFELAMPSATCNSTVVKNHTNVEYALQRTLTADRYQKQPVSPLLSRCDFIFNSILRKTDDDLYTHMKGIGIEPQLFLLRWIRVLFSREFSVGNTLQIWDAIFADFFSLSLQNLLKETHITHDYSLTATYTNDYWQELPLIDYLTIAMTRYTRETLLSLDNSECLKRLLRFPPIENAQNLIEVALELRKMVCGIHILSLEDKACDDDDIERSTTTTTGLPVVGLPKSKMLRKSHTDIEQQKFYMLCSEW